ncbi:MAG TPA: DUF4873 domain-containing protein [Nocardioidaceae bacterium]|nr:DUF4873 domain-containing protein [Nocardioidaceae bacterium]
MNEYDGPAELVTGEQSIPVRVALRVMFQPIDGHTHWYARIAADDALDAAVRSGAQVLLRTPYGQASGKLSDRDPWGRYRVAGLAPSPIATG